MTVNRNTSSGEPSATEATPTIDQDLRCIANMFGDYRDDAIMRELCRLAIKCAQERLIRGG